MIARTFINRIIIFAFMVLVGYSLARAIQFGSLTGIILATISLVAGIYFLALLARIKYERQKQEESI